MKTNKITSMLIVSLLVLSTGFVIHNAVDTAKADYLTEPTTDTPVHWTLSNDGLGSLERNLTVGEIITLRITNNSLPRNTNYRVRVWDGDGWQNLTAIGSRLSDNYGDLSISFRVPGWGELDKNPVTEKGDDGLEPGQWTISLFSNDYTTQIFADLNATINIGNQYLLKFFVDDVEVDHILYKAETVDFQVKIYNWTGTGTTPVEAKNDATNYKFDVSLHNYSATPPGALIENLGTDRIAGVSQKRTFNIGDNYITDDDKEKTFWVHVKHSDFPALNSTIALPVLLDVTMTEPTSDKTWGDTFDIRGQLRDGADTAGPINSYNVGVYAPIDGDYVEVDTYTTSGSAATTTYVIEAFTGSNYQFSAGTWYVGTQTTGDGRVDMSHQPPYVAGFIPYHTFDVNSKDEARVSLVNTEDIVSGFTSKINVTVRNETWMKDDEYKQMNVHISGVEVEVEGVTYRAGDRVLVTSEDSKNTTSLAWYEFDVIFEKTGTVTVEVSTPGNLTEIWHTATVDGESGTHSAKYRNEDLKANITGKTTFSVVSPSPMTVLIPEMVEEVQIEEACTGGRKNETGVATRIHVYGDAENKPMNASITVTGAGLDFTIDESRTEAGTGKGSTYLKEYDFDTDTKGSWYDVYILPKTAGVVTITVTNGTTGRTVTRDYTIDGLTGSVTTSDGDDLEITVGTTETITVTTGNDHEYITVTYFDEEWNCVGDGLLNETDSDKPTVKSFTPDEDKITNLGYIVVVAGHEAFGLYMYEIIEVVAVDDLVVEVIEPEEGNRTLTVGIDNDLVVELHGPDGELVTDNNPGLVVKLVDEDNDWDDPLQEWGFTGSESEFTIVPWFPGQLIIEGYNASDGIKHIGRTVLDVDYATITYSPAGATAGIGMEDVTVEVTAVDANGNPITGTLYLYDTENSSTYDGPAFVELTDGEGEFDIVKVGDEQATIVGVWQAAADPEDGNATTGAFYIDFPTFTLAPDTIYVGQANVVEVTAKDMNGVALAGINITFMRDGNRTDLTPTPVKTDADGKAIFSLNPSSSGALNVTIIKRVIWVGGALDWTTMQAERVVTDTVLTITHIRTMHMAVSAPSVYQAETFTVTMTSGGVALSLVAVEFAGVTVNTNAEGIATFTAPDPVIDSLLYPITATKAGYHPAEKSITVIKVYQLRVNVPTKPIEAGSTFTVEVLLIGKGAAVGAEVTFNEETTYTDSTGRATFTAPSPNEKTTYDVTIQYEGYDPITSTVTVGQAETPGFELLTLIIALGVAFILLKKRRKK